jgi:hypothetical protein
MRKFIGVLLFAILLSGLSSCRRNTIAKPDDLIKRAKFEKMMVDMYIIQGLNTGINSKPILKKVSQTDLYFSILKKYSVTDTVFVRSLIYYSSFPKEYEKMHVEIMNILNQAEEQYKPTNKLQTGKE